MQYECRESQYLCNDETSTNGIACNRSLYAIQCSVYRWVGKGDNVIVTVSDIMESTCICAHVTVLCNHD